MKAKFSLAIIATTALLTACGGNHEKVHAVDKVEEAQKLALEKAPKAEEVKFADHGQTPMGGVGGANPAPTAEATATSTDTKPAETATPATAETTATAPADTAQETADTTKPADEPAKTEIVQTETTQAETDTAETPKAQ